jgi:outer membrane lipoprotein carrier protein
MKIRHAWFVKCFFCLFIGFGVSPAQNADSVMTKSAQWFHASRGWSLDFGVILYYADSPETATQQGSLLVGENNRFRLTIPGIVFYSDGITIWQWNKDQKQVLIKSVEDLSSTLHPSELLFKYLNCKATAVKKDVWKGQPVYVLTLNPSRYGKQFKAMEVWLSAGDYSPVRLCTTDSMGNVSWYNISNLRRQQKIADAEFLYKHSKDVDEIDMR